MGFEVEHYYGVPCLCDYIADNDLKADPESFAQLEQLALAVRDKFPHSMIARFWHLMHGRPNCRSSVKNHEDTPHDYHRQWLFTPDLPDLVSTVLHKSYFDRTNSGHTVGGGNRE